MGIGLFLTQMDVAPWEQRLQAKLPEVRIQSYPHIASKEDIRLAICWDPAPHALEGLPNLQVVQSIAAGIDHITQSQNFQPGIRLCRFVDPQLTQGVFEYVLAGIMGQLRPHHQMGNAWQPKRHTSISETTVTVLGLGAIGRSVAFQLADLGFKVRGWSKSLKDHPPISSYAGHEQLKEAISGADYLVNILPLTPETTNVLDEATVSCLNRGGYVINVGRGDHLVEADLLNLLDAGHLSGALLDVFREEPLPPSHPFWHHPKVTITPHIAGIRNEHHFVELVSENWHRMNDQRPLLHQVSLGKGY